MMAVDMIPGGSALEFLCVSKNYGTARALRSVSFRVNRGESVALLGSNGAGKTTLLKIAATQSTPTAGTVRICGEDTKNTGSSVRSRIGFVSHDSYLYNELTVRENLRYYSRIFSVPEEEYLPLVAYFGLSERYDRQVKTLSCGMRKRADIIRAALHRPALILLDEPFAGLDDTGCRLLVDFFQDRKREGISLVLSSHSRYWAGMLCDRTLSLRQGTVVAGEPEGPGGKDDSP